MVVPTFGTWGMLKDNVLFAFTITVATPCQKFEARHGLISSRYLIPLPVDGAACAHVQFSWCGRKVDLHDEVVLMPDIS